SPVQHLMTKDEKKQWKAIKTDADAAAFIDLFWAKRDPTPDTPRNEYREAFDARVKYADDNFTSHRLRGALTDRGKALILLGPPEQVSGTAGGLTESSPSSNIHAPENADGSLALPGATSAQSKQVWTYAHGKKPTFIRQADFTLNFIEVG